MDNLQNSVEKVVAVTTGAAVVSSLGLLLSKHNSLYPYTETNSSLAVYGALGSVLGSTLWFSFRK
tara:strand:- start:51 stop:245 length:195 start_codon:yes stop_codon:yes gene_type:complete